MNSATPRWKTTVFWGLSSNSQENRWGNRKVCHNSHPVDRTSQTFTSKPGGQGRCSSSLQLEGKTAVPPYCGSEELTQTSACCLHQSLCLRKLFLYCYCCGFVLFLPSLLHMAAKHQAWGGNQALNTLTCSGKSSSSLPALTILRYLGFSSLSPYKNTTPFPHFVLYQSFIALGTIMEASHLGNSAVLLMDASSASWSHSFARLHKAAKTLCRCKLVGLDNSQQISTDQHWLGNPPQYLQSWKPKQHCLAPIHASAALFRAQPHKWSLEPTGRLKSMICVKGSTVKTFVL